VFDLLVGGGLVLGLSAFGSFLTTALEVPPARRSLALVARA
jgi:hypothetical protein